MVVRDGGVGCGLTIDPEIIVFELVLINCAQSSLLRPCDGWCGAVVWCGVVWWLVDGSLRRCRGVGVWGDGVG